MLSEDLLRAALDEAKAAGANYAEARAESGVRDGVHVRNDAVERLSTDHDSGWGIHVLAGGGWGFAASSSQKPSDVRATAARAVEIARASAAHRHSVSYMDVMSTEEGTYATPKQRDALQVPLEERIDLILQ